MQLKQTAFDFDMPVEESKPVTKLVPPKQVFVVQEEPIDIDLRPASVTKPKEQQKKSSRGRMKLSDMAATVEKIDIPDDEELFSKRYYSIGSVSEMFQVNHSLLRFWENEFDILKPKKNGKGDRFFRPEDIKNLKLIHNLLRERKFTIEGAKDFLKKNKNADKKFETIESLKNLRVFLHELKAGL
jgi:DNA-binding transcriptional MerR regulator